jgi:hypothetical protein
MQNLKSTLSIQILGFSPLSLGRTVWVKGNDDLIPPPLLCRDHQMNEQQQRACQREDQCVDPCPVMHHGPPPLSPVMPPALVSAICWANTRCSWLDCVKAFTAILSSHLILCLPLRIQLGGSSRCSPASSSTSQNPLWHPT